MFHDIGIMIFVEFQDWIREKYRGWRGDAIGQEKSQIDFAKEIGVTHQTLNNWLHGSVPKNQAVISKLVDYFGVEVYDVLGLERPTGAQIDSKVEGLLSHLGSMSDAEIIVEVFRLAEEFGYYYQVEREQSDDESGNGGRQPGQGRTGRGV